MIEWEESVHFENSKDQGRQLIKEKKLLHWKDLSLKPKFHEELTPKAQSSKCNLPSRKSPRRDIFDKW